MEHGAQRNICRQQNKRTDLCARCASLLLSGKTNASCGTTFRARRGGSGLRGNQYTQFLLALAETDSQGKVCGWASFCKASSA